MTERGHAAHVGGMARQWSTRHGACSTYDTSLVTWVSHEYRK